ncbi:hypothetical protein K492DRAFT_136204, partial [Lichtheimia hyalospora FSU 10163]
NGFPIIGYARKSPGSEKKDTRIALLSTMMNLSRSRSMVDKVFISLCSRTSEPIADRDKSDTLAVIYSISKLMSISSWDLAAMHNG